MADSYSKKENFKKKQEKRKQKDARREARKTDNNKGKDAEELFMYVDAYGRLTHEKPEKPEEINIDDIQLGAT